MIKGRTADLVILDDIVVDNYEMIRNKVAEQYYQQMTVSLVPLPVPPSVPYCMEACKKEKGNNPMEDKVYYLKSRIDEIAYDFKNAFTKQFKVTSPKTFAELVTAITAGAYTVSETSEKRYNIFDGVTWGDSAGYDAAIAAMKVQKKIATDAVMVKDPATDGLAAMQAFEAWTYTAPTTVN